MAIPSDRSYTADHEWIKFDGDVARVGITAHAADALGDIVFVDLPDVGRQVAAAEACAVVESVKAASDIYAPLAGEVLEINGLLDGAPETINADPYGAGWMFRLAVRDPAALAGLLDAAGYARSVDAAAD